MATFLFERLEAYKYLWTCTAKVCMLSVVWCNCNLQLPITKILRPLYDHSAQSYEQNSVHTYIEYTDSVLTPHCYPYIIRSLTSIYQLNLEPRLHGGLQKIGTLPADNELHP